MQDARRNASGNGIANATFAAMDLTRTMPNGGDDLPRPDVVIVGETLSSALLSKQAMLICPVRNVAIHDCWAVQNDKTCLSD